MSETNLRSALSYAERGWAVLPIYEIEVSDGTSICACLNPFCSAPGKHPRISGGVKNASMDEAKIRDWWGRWPNANIAVAAGRVSNLIVIDLDVSDAGKNGEERITEFLAAREIGLDHTLEQRTGGGGCHRFYRYPQVGTIKNIVGWLEGVDVRSDGGYVLVAPSKHLTGGAYHWSSDPASTQIASLGALASVLEKAKGTVTPRSGSNPLEPPPAYDYQDAIANGPRRGYRDHFFNAHAYALRKRGLEREEIIDVLGEIYNRMPDDEQVDFSADVVVEKARRVCATVEPDPVTPAYRPRELTEEEEGGLPEAFNNEFTDLGNARRLVERWGDRLRYSRAIGWLVWNGTHWSVDDSQRVMRAFQLVLNEMLDQTQGLEEGTDAKKMLVKHALASQSDRAMKAAVNGATFQIEVVISPEELDRDVFKLACPNGTVDLRTGEMHQPDSADLITNLSPVLYQPGFRSERWEKFLADVTGGDTDLQAYLQRAAGYSITGDTTEDATFFIFGPPGSGKSTFLDAMLTILGSMGMTLQAEAIAGRSRDSFPYPEIANMLSKRIVVVSELEEGMKLRENLVKKMSGGDKLVGRHLYKDRFEFSATHKLWIATNHLPRVFSDAMWRRIRALPFPNRVINPDYQLRAQAKEPTSELATAALVWAVEGAVAWHQQRLGTCAAVEEATAEYQEDEDRLTQFLSEECVLDPTAITSTGELYDRWLIWCEAAGERPGTKNLFSRQLKERDSFQKMRDTRGRWGFAGIALKGASQYTGGL